MSGTVPRERTWFLLIFAACALVRLAVAIADHGTIVPDEIFQTLEPAHRMTFGPGVVAWEFRDGVRSWFFPAQFAPFLALGDLFGATSGLALVTWAKLLIVAYQVLAAVGTARLGTALHSPKAGMLAALIVVLLPMQLIFGSRCLSEVATQTWVVWAVFHLVRDRGRAALWVGALLGCAVFVRYQNGIFVLTILGVYVARHRWADLRLFVGASLVIALLGGLLDFLTWGGFLHSFAGYVKFNLLDDGASRFGVYPWHYYLTTLTSATGALTLVGIVGHVVALDARRAWLKVIFAIECVYVAAHSVIGHKELRFMLPLVPLAAVMTAVGWCVIAERLTLRRRYALSAVALGAVLAVIHAAGLTMRDVGYPLGYANGAPREASASAWGIDDGLDRALSYAGAEVRACGVTVIGSVGAYAYLHKNIPLSVGDAADVLAASDVAITMDGGPPPGYVPRARFGKVTVAQRTGGCGPSRRAANAAAEGLQAGALARPTR